MNGTTADSPVDVAILGAGAAGLLSAIRAAERGRSVVLLEKNRKPGVKILMSGGTRCNLTNARGLRGLETVSGPIDPGLDRRLCVGPRGILAAFTPEAGRFLAKSLKAFSPDAAVRLFESAGLSTKVEANGKLFPSSDRAVDVVAALVRLLERSGARLRLNCPVHEVRRESESVFALDAPDGPIYARRVVVAVGGRSYPGCGTVGDGYGIAQRVGHAIVETRPALVPLRVRENWVGELRGITLPDASARVVDESGRVLAERREAVLFAHFGLTGPAILDVSRAVARSDQPEALRLELDLLPDQRPDRTDADLAEQARRGRRKVASLLPGFIPARLAEAIVEASAVPTDRHGPELSRDERKRLVAGLHGLRLGVAGTLGFDKAEVTSGGVSLDEVDPATMGSKIQPGLHFVGEVLDVDGLIGGYNFQAAWSTGWLAGESV